jgi:hypothetical protein
MCQNGEAGEQGMRGSDLWEERAWSCVGMWTDVWEGVSV